MTRGCFIVFEGLDGSGKSTQFRQLSDNLEKENYKVVKTKEPTVNLPVGKLIREILYEKDEVREIPGEALALLFAADRIDHISTKVKPALKENSVVISDRYVYSSYAYQSKGMKKEIDLTWLYNINKYAIDPDIVIFLDITPELGQERLRDGQKRVQDHTYFETLVQQQRIRSVYYNIFNLDKNSLNLFNFVGNEENEEKEIKMLKMRNTIIVRIDGSLSREKIGKLIFNFVKTYLENNKIPKADEKGLKTQSLTVF